MTHISISKADVHLYAVWARAAQSMGIPLSVVPSKYVLALSSGTSLEISTREGVNYLSTDALKTLSDRQALAGLGVSVLPTITPLNAGELLAFGDGPVFVKPANTSLTKSKDALAYTKWDSPQHLLSSVNATFWEKQSNATTSFCVQPFVPYPITEITVSISVNEPSEAFVFFSTEDTSETIDYRNFVRKLESVPQYILDDVQKVCTALTIKGGVHDIQFVEYGGRFYMNDWNARSGDALNGGLARSWKPSALAHMVGEPIPEMPNLYAEQRRYFARGIPDSMAYEARVMGMHARVYGGFLDRVYYEGSDVAAVHAQFNILETKFLT